MPERIPFFFFFSNGSIEFMTLEVNGMTRENGREKERFSR